MINKGLMSSNTAEWSTPQDFFNRYNDLYDFNVDVCATPENTKCPRYWTKEQDGLAQDWSGLVCWMNPPYGREIGSWVKKAAESKALTVCLLPARTDTRWFHDYIYERAKIEFIKGRLKFGGAKNSAPFPSMVVIFDGRQRT